MEDVSVTNFPDAGSKERVAFEVAKHIVWVGGLKLGKVEFLDLISESMHAISTYKNYK
ncbi:MAG: hypothetical protein ACU0CA_01900 [Paracoccaceae bacterium]